MKRPAKGNNYVFARSTRVMECFLSSFPRKRKSSGFEGNPATFNCAGVPLKPAPECLNREAGTTVLEYHANF